MGGGRLGGLVDVVSSYDNGPAAIGYSVFYYVSDMYGTTASVCSESRRGPGQGFHARAASTRSRPCYYAVLRKNTPENHPARQLLAWLLSDEGAEGGAGRRYVPLRELD
jgi:phosphate transport system substrate-binding protein